MLVNRGRVSYFVNVWLGNYRHADAYVDGDGPLLFILLRVLLVRPGKARLHGSALVGNLISRTSQIFVS